MSKAALRRTRWRRRPCREDHDGNPRRRVTRSTQRARQRRTRRREARLHLSAHSGAGHGDVG